MTRRLFARAETWPLARPFAISRGTKTEAQVVVAEVADGPRRGRGECVPYARYGETVAQVLADIEAMAGAVAGGLDRDALRAAMPAGAARNALDCALWDLEAKAAGRRAWDLAGLPAPGPVTTAETIGVDTPAAMGARAAELAARPLLKVKVDGAAVVERLAAVRAGAPGARLVVDANEAWDLDLLRSVAGPLADLGVEMIEQPLPAGADGDLDGYAGPVVLCADESGHGVADLDRLAGRYGMVNVKLDKTGGLTAALDLAAAARAAGLAVMVGCMVGTSLAMAPALLLAADAAVVDLDGPVFLSRDRAPGLVIDNGTIHPPPADLWG
ncbi:MAG: L-Ala-D/L-Glu epimerase [Hyphomicrobiales bacterium]|nr:L-Ala-D/L-Glu epimerase [Hyphomicrobiales bacterium]MCP5370889.1 L-Ala-D/L-Glu epimerase [Hyphomicrobiales bacterium]